jgi:hypothetical protein
VLCGEIILENSIGFHEVSYEVSAAKKYQIANHNDQNSKSDSAAFDGLKP